MRPGYLSLVALVALVGCASRPEAASEGAALDRSGCRDQRGDAIEASMRFADARFELAWQRRCDRSATRVFRALNPGEGAAARLVTLTRYPPRAEPQGILDAYIARSGSRRVGEPRVFERGATDGATRYIVELMLRRPDTTMLEYVLHGVTRTGADGRVVSVTYTHRFNRRGDTGLERINAKQQAWAQAVERELEGFPAP